MPPPFWSAMQDVFKQRKATGGVSHPTVTGGCLGRAVRTGQTHSNTSPRLVGLQIKKLIIKRYGTI